MTQNITLTSPTFAAGEAAFGNRLTGGYSLSAANYLPANTFTFECRISASGITATKVFADIQNAFYLAANASGQLYARFGITEQTLTSTANISDGNPHHVALTIHSAGAILFLDGAVVATSAVTPATADVRTVGRMELRTFRNYAGGTTAFDWPGTVDEVAVWSAPKYLAAFTAPTVPYTGAEANLYALYHLESDGTDSVGAAATSVTISGPSSGTVGVASTNFTASLNGVSATDVVVTPSDAGAGGTFTPTTVTITAGSTTGTFTYTASSTGTKTITATNGSGLTNAGSVSYAASSASATAVTLSGPSTGTAGAASTAFTVGANGTISGTVIVTPSDGGAGGTFSPTTVSISSGSPTGTFTYTAASSGAKTISVSNNGALTNPGSITYTASAGVNNAYAPANILFSPYNWDAQSGYAKTINAGAYFRTIFGGTACTLNFDMTGIASPVPQISYRVDGFGAWITVPIAATVAITVSSKTADYAAKGGHFLEVLVKSTTEGQPRWSTQATAVVLTGVILDAGKVLTKPPSRSLLGLYFGDSITEGVRTVGTIDPNDTDRNDAGQGWALQSAQLVGAECGVVGFGGTGFNNSGSGSVPNLVGSAPYLWSGVARSLSPAPDFIVINDGTNDSASVTANATTVLNALIAATPKTTKIILYRPFSGTHAAELIAAVAACSDPSRVTYKDTTGYFNTTNSVDGVHPYGIENLSHIAPLVAADIRNAVSPLRGTRTLRTSTITLVNKNEVPQASLTGLKWSFFDQPTSDQLTVAADQGSVETTDGSGTLTIPVYTTLPSGGVGWLVVTNTDGNPATVHKAFSGPVTVV